VAGIYNAELRVQFVCTQNEEGQFLPLEIGRVDLSISTPTTYYDSGEFGAFIVLLRRGMTAMFKALRELTA
jgi:hypothetical protein